MIFKSGLYVILALITLIAPRSSFAEANSEIQELKQNLSMMRAEILKIKSQSLAIGSVQQSFLTEAAFQKQMGKGWVLCDGRAVPGSAWEKLGYGSHVPSCTGLFLRSTGGNAAPLGKEQGQATAKNTLQATATTTLVSNMKVDVSGTTADASWTGTLATAVTDDATFDSNSKGGLEAWGNRVVGRDGEYWGRMFSHQHVFGGTGTATGGSWSTTVNLSGDTETRPVNISVNTFIRVD